MVSEVGCKAVVNEQVTLRSYVVETPDSVHSRRNRKYLLKTEENICGKLDLEMKSNETETVNTQIPLNNSDTEKVSGEVSTPTVQLRMSEYIRVHPKRLIEEI